MTLPGLAYKLGKTSAVLEEVNLMAPIGQDEPMIRAAYRGGRCEVLNHEGRSNLHYVDFNSLYPVVAASFDYPCGFGDHGRHSIGTNQIGIYYCKIKTTNAGDNIPFLPVKYENTTIYPLGEGYSCYTSAELQYAQSLGYYKIEIIKDITYKAQAPLFEEYVNKIFEGKQEAEKTGNAGQRTMAKLLMNSVFDKLGQKMLTVRISLESVVQEHDLPPPQPYQEKKMYPKVID